MTQTLDDFKMTQTLELANKNSYSSVKNDVT